MVPKSYEGILLLYAPKTGMLVVPLSTISRKGIRELLLYFQGLEIDLIEFGGEL